MKSFNQHISDEDLDKKPAEPIDEATMGDLLIGLGAIPAGWLSDRWSRSAMIVIMFIGMGLSSILCGLSNEKFLLFIGLSFLGLSCSIYHPVGIAWVVNATIKKGN